MMMECVGWLQDKKHDKHEKHHKKDTKHDKKVAVLLHRVYCCFRDCC